MEFNIVAEEPGCLRVECEGEISQSFMEGAEDPLKSLLGPTGYSQTVLLNLVKTTYIDSRGLGWLVASHKRFVEANGRLIVHSAPPRVYQVLQIVRLPTIMEIVADEMAAKERLTGGAT